MHKIKSQEENKMLWQIEKNAINFKIIVAGWTNF